MFQSHTAPISSEFGLLLFIRWLIGFWQVQIWYLENRICTKFCLVCEASDDGWRFRVEGLELRLRRRSVGIVTNVWYRKYCIECIESNVLNWMYAAHDATLYLYRNSICISPFCARPRAADGRVMNDYEDWSCYHFAASLLLCHQFENGIVKNNWWWLRVAIRVLGVVFVVGHLHGLRPSMSNGY